MFAAHQHLFALTKDRHREALARAEERRLARRQPSDASVSR